MKTNAVQSFITALLITLSFLISSPASAIRSVGNGGGFAELQFIYYFENSKYLVQFCLQDSRACPLDLEQKELWQRLLHSTEQINSKYSIGFVTAGASAWKLESDKLVVYSPGLYDLADVALPEYKILAYAVAVQLSLIQDLKNDFNETLKKTEKAFKGIEFQNKKVGLSLQGENIYFHQLKVKLNQQILTFFALEDAQQSYFLNQSISAKYPTLDLNSVSFSQMTSAQVHSKGMFFGLLNGADTNGTRYQNRKVRLQFDLNSQGHINLNSMEFDVALK